MEMGWGGGGKGLSFFGSSGTGSSLGRRKSRTLEPGFSAGGSGSGSGAGFAASGMGKRRVSPASAGGVGLTSALASGLLSGWGGGGGSGALSGSPATARSTSARIFRSRPPPYSARISSRE